MISKREILYKAEEWKVPANTVDKDYVLGHFLRCFFEFGDNQNLFVFKGGTCLRKCYFPQYRFSEDLDFTLLDKSLFVDQSFLDGIAKQCESSTGIRFYVKKIDNKKHKNEEKGYECTVTFWGANHSANQAPGPKEMWVTKIKIDFSFDEEILFPINHNKILHPYSDGESFKSVTIPTYSLEEILTEKIRAFYQRSYNAPRDYYDVWYLLNNVLFDNWETIKNLLRKKCELKKVVINPNIFSDKEIKKNVSKAWKNSIAHHLPEETVPDFEYVWSFLSSNLFVVLLK